jgi:hypothetical protein
MWIVAALALLATAVVLVLTVQARRRAGGVIAVGPTSPQSPDDRPSASSRQSGANGARRPKPGGPL